MSNIEKKVIAITAETLNTEEPKITPDSNFVNDLGADSLDQVELMMALEAEFGCEIPDEDASKIATIRDAAEYIKQKTSA